jgi:hypothetical protein
VPSYPATLNGAGGFGIGAGRGVRVGSTFVFPLNGLFLRILISIRSNSERMQRRG